MIGSTVVKRVCNTNKNFDVRCSDLSLSPFNLEQVDKNDHNLFDFISKSLVKGYYCALND